MIIPALRSAIRMLLCSALLLSLGPGCRDRAVGVDLDAGPDARASDAGPAPDAGPTPDAGPPEPCAPERLSMGFVLQTAVTPVEPEPGVQEFTVSGQVSYLGPITTPLATNPAFNREVQIQDAAGDTSILQYYLPGGLQLPVQVGGGYEILYRSQIDFESYRVGVIVTRPTSGLHPLLFVGDAGPLGRAFAAEEARMNPLKVYVQDTDCPVTDDPECPGSQHYQDQLRFDSSTGGAITDVVVPQSESAELAVFGDPFLVMNLASWHRDPPCVDDPGYQAIYLAARISELPPTCDPDRFYWWDEPHPELGVGDYCDELFFCVDDAAAADQAALTAPSISCEPDEASCGGGYRCDFPSSETIDQARLDEMCAVSVMPLPPTRIICGVYI